MLPTVPIEADVGDSDSSIHPRLRAANAEMMRDRLALDLDRARFAAPEIEIGWKRISVDNLSFDGPVLGASWRVPVPGRRKALIATAEAAVEGSAARLARREREVSATRTAAKAAYAHRYTSVSQLPPPDDRLRAAVIEAFHLGEGSLTDLLDTLGALHGAASDDLDLLEDALAAHRALELAVGHPLETTP
jgi:cobalt-zinc-cadmium efflux system outer membrane protein